MKYRITEITNEGQSKVSAWQTIESCSALLDVTTPANQLTCKKKDLEIEVAENWFAEGDCSLKLLIAYTINRKPKYKYVNFEIKTLTQEISFFHDINSEIHYQINQIEEDKIIYKSSEILLTDNYLFLNKLP